MANGIFSHWVELDCDGEVKRGSSVGVQVSVSWVQIYGFFLDPRGGGWVRVLPSRLPFFPFLFFLHFFFPSLFLPFLLSWRAPLAI